MLRLSMWLSACLVAGGLAVSSTASLGGADEVKPLPNIIIILADDAGYADFGFQGGHDIETPTLDQLALDGARFTNAYVTTPFCSPSRAGLITGRHPLRYGYEFNLAMSPEPGDDPEMIGLPIEESTIADQLKAVGYRTGVIGKWHLGHLPQFHPLNRGFDYFFGFLGGSRNYFPMPEKRKASPADGGAQTVFRQLLDRTRRLELNRQPAEPRGDVYLTDLFGDAAAAYVRESASQPFFLYLAFNAVHMPLQAAPKDLKRFAHVEDRQRRILAAMTWAMDRAVARLLQALVDEGLVDNTLVIFLNDNGGDRVGIGADNGPLRGMKGTLLEGGLRVPLVMRWPGVVPAGMVDDRPVSSLDVFPTALAAAGVPRGENLDGSDLVAGMGRGGLPERTLYWRYDVAAAIRDGNWKLIRFPDRPPVLYDLVRDIGEQQDLAAKEPARVRAMMKKLFAWEGGMTHARWVTDPFWSQEDIRRYDAAHVLKQRARVKARLDQGSH